MNAETVIATIKLLKDNGIDVVVDGGWGVDALLGKQSRVHDDLDVAIPHKDVPKLRKILSKIGYLEIPRDDSSDCNFVLQDHHKNQIDVHSYIFDADGNNIFGVAYLPEHFTGKGIINNYPVKCIAPEWMVKFHTGYELDQNDFLDTLALCRKFNIPLPDEYKKFVSETEP
jgi:lincosamide nucleotidyltransferase A/C/D/E